MENKYMHILYFYGFSKMRLKKYKEFDLINHNKERYFAVKICIQNILYNRKDFM